MFKGALQPSWIYFFSKLDLVRYNITSQNIIDFEMARSPAVLKLFYIHSETKTVEREILFRMLHEDVELLRWSGFVSDDF